MSTIKRHAMFMSMSLAHVRHCIKAKPGKARWLRQPWPSATHTQGTGMEFHGV